MLSRLSKDLSPKAKPTWDKDLELATAAAQKVVAVHHHLHTWLKVGMTLPQIDSEVRATLQKLGCRSAFYKYDKVPKLPPFPNHACLSVNACVVHGTAAAYTLPLKPGDLLKIDIGVWFQGFVGDAGWTYHFGTPNPTAQKLMAVGKESLRLGIAELRPGQPLLKFAQAVQGHVEREHGLHLVRGLGGHGYGRKVHESPFVSNSVPESPGEWPDHSLRCQPGLLIAVEPMIAVGTGEVVSEHNRWPVLSRDNSMTVHYEHDVMIAPEGPRILTAGMDDIQDIIER